MDPVVAGLVIVAVGLLLCFFGVGSVHLAVIASGFGLGWMLGDLFGASQSTALLLGVLGGLVAWIAVAFVFKLASFFIGIVTGAVIGAKLYGTVSGDSDNWILAAIIVIAVAAACGFLADKYRRRALLWLTTIGGAGLVLGGLGRVSPDTLGFLRDPSAGWEQVVSFLAWAALALAGWLVQRKLFAKRLGITRGEAEATKG